jgi:hypothetical protein
MIKSIVLVAGITVCAPAYWSNSYATGTAYTYNVGSYPAYARMSAMAACQASMAATQRQALRRQSLC